MEEIKQSRLFTITMLINVTWLLLSAANGITAYVLQTHVSLLSNTNIALFFAAILADLVFWVVYWLHKDAKLVRDLFVFVSILGVVLYTFTFILQG